MQQLSLRGVLMKSERRSNLCYWADTQVCPYKNEIAALRPAQQDFARNDKVYF
jgi:hypothetical protein